MATLEEVLQSLNPPIRYELLVCDEQAKLYLTDIVTGVIVERRLSRRQCERQEQFGVVLLCAVNELRLKGANVPLLEIPQWTGLRRSLIPAFVPPKSSTINKSPLVGEVMTGWVPNREEKGTQIQFSFEMASHR